MSKTKTRKKRRRSQTPKNIEASLERFRAASSVRCDSCGVPAHYHAPMWDEPDPYLISFWAALCRDCILDHQSVIKALRAIRQRGWARPGPPPDDDELPPRTPRPWNG